MPCRFKYRSVIKFAFMLFGIYAIGVLFVNMFTPLPLDHLGQENALPDIEMETSKRNRFLVFTGKQPSISLEKTMMKNSTITRLGNYPERKVFTGKQPSICLEKTMMKNSTITRLGNYPEGKGFLTIGISSIARPGGDKYLLRTIQGLVNHTNDEDRREIFVVIFLADFDEAAKFATLTELSNRFRKYIDKGFIRVISAPNEFYPALSNMKTKFGDNQQRIFWRSKQNVDFAFIMCYCHGHSQYYLHLEDDVFPAPSFYPKLRDFISSVKTNWPILDASFMGHLAKIYHANDLENLATYFYLMYDEMPVDWLIAFWRKIKYDRPIHHEFIFPPASLFQHIGSRSSLAQNKGRDTNASREKYFDKYDLKYKGLNPSAIVSSEMKSAFGHPQDAYNKGYGYFRAKEVKKDDFIIVQFTPAVSMRKVFVDTGSYIAPDDYLQSAVLQASFNNKNELQANSDGKKTCTVFETITNFQHGKAEVTFNESKNTLCLRVLVTKSQANWVFFREIDVWQV